jgi:hypothetical protein
MRLASINRQEPITAGNIPVSRFSNLMEDLVSEVNDLTAVPIRNISDDTTVLVTDVVVRNTGGNVVVTIPADTFDIGSSVEFQNDGTGTMKIACDDTLTSSAGLGTGTRTIASGGESRVLLVADGKWKIRGEQIT